MSSMLANILKWSLSQQGQAEDAPASSAPPMSESDRAWLKEALESVMVNAVKRIKQLEVIISLPETEADIQRLVAEHGTAAAAAEAKQHEVEKKKSGPQIPVAKTPTPSSSQSAALQASSSSASSTSSSLSSTSSVLNSTPLPLGLPPSDTIYNAQPIPTTATISAASSATASPPSAAYSSASSSSPPAITSSSEHVLSTLQEILIMKRKALEELEDLVSHLDHADDFVAIGGLPHLLTLFHSNDAGVRWRAAAVLSTLIDNHRKTADAAVKLKALEAVIRLLQPPAMTASVSQSETSMSDDWRCVAKCLGCLSAFIRSETNASEVFLTLHGPVRVSALLSHCPPPAVLRKTFSVLRLSLTLFPSTASLFLPATAAASASATPTPALLSFFPAALNSSDLNVREECARFLAHLCKSAPLADAIGDDSLGIRTAVNFRRKSIEEADAEEKDGLEDELVALEEVARLCNF